MAVSEQDTPGVLVEAMAADSSAAQAGLQVGDRLLRYAGRVLVSPATWQAAEENTFGGNTVSLEIRRGSQNLSFPVKPGMSGIEVRLDLPPEVLSLYEAGRAARQEQRNEEARTWWQEAAQAAQDRGELAGSAWLWFLVGKVNEALFQWHEALTAYAAAREIEQKREDTAAQWRIALETGRSHDYLRDYTAAQQGYEQAYQIAVAAGYEVWAAASLNGLGNVAYSLNNDLTVARDLYSRAFVLLERLAPNSLYMAASLSCLGNFAFEYGDLTVAQNYYRRSLTIYEQLVPESLNTAVSLHNCGLLESHLGDFASAWDYHTRALHLREKLAPASLYVAFSLNHLGHVALMQGDMASAQNYHLRALDIRERHAPGSLPVAYSLNSLGVVAYKCGDFSMAQGYHEAALTLFKGLATNPLDVAMSLHHLGEVAFAQGDLPKAQEYHSQALEVNKRLAPNTLDVAENLDALGRIALCKQHFQGALAFFQHAIEIVETQRQQIFSPNVRALLLAQHADKYTHLMQTYLALNDLPAAFATLERARARSLVELLAQRKMDFHADAPDALLLRQKELNQERKRAYNALADCDEADDEAIQKLHSTLRALERQQEELAVQIQQTSPRYAALQYPVSLDSKGAQTALDPDTLLLAYQIDEQITYLFAVTHDSLQCFSLNVRQKDLEKKVQTFRQELDKRRLGSTLEAAIQQGKALYDLLLRPAQVEIGCARRLLLCPDGPLHTLPFAALVSGETLPPRYLGQDKPLHTTLSMTVYAQQRQQTTRITTRKNFRLLAVGDPIYKRTASTPASSLRSSRLLLPIPATRREVESIGTIYPENAILLLGHQTTKTAVLQTCGKADLLHFACHGLLDNEMPLSSALVLSQPEAPGDQALPEDNGLLQAWEIFEQMRLKADLVVLSACETGLGPEVRGEGLIGLTRAFTYAGARSVLVSLWEINDGSTADFMEIFYKALRAGASKNAALQTAMRALSEQDEWAHPYHWAAFALSGVWR